MQSIEDKYKLLCDTPSDINEHLPVLYKYAKECDSIIECGIRGCVSSWGFVHGLLQNTTSKADKVILLNDIDECDISELLEATKNLSIHVEYNWVNDLELNLNRNYDLVFIDTWHIYGHLKRELNKFAPYTNKYIIMHDTTTDEIHGEVMRFNRNPIEASEKCGYPVEEITCGLGRAITEFLNKNHDWELLEKFTNNNGLTILKRRQSFAEHLKRFIDYWENDNDFKHVLNHIQNLTKPEYNICNYTHSLKPDIQNKLKTYISAIEESMPTMERSSSYSVKDDLNLLLNTCNEFSIIKEDILLSKNIQQCWFKIHGYIKNLYSCATYKFN